MKKRVAALLFAVMCVFTLAFAVPATAGTAAVRHVRVLVHRPADAVTAELVVHRIAVPGGDGADRRDAFPVRRRRNLCGHVGCPLPSVLRSGAWTEL